MKQTNLYDKLNTYGKSDYYAFHMPGHKRQAGMLGNPFLIDITEIDGFDDLHHPEENGILKHAQEKAAKLYDSEETHFLVNGSTAGILSAISGCTCRRGKILVARNCHRSVYHGIMLRDLKAEYVYPQESQEFGINGSIFPEDVDNCLKQNSDIQAVILTSPTYDGICSNIGEIGRIAHERNIPLIVDQAHGAHFPFHSYFPQDAIKAGADVVIHSVHKTLPSLTQTALLHLNGNLVDRKRIREFLSIYQTSSPSYVLMASIDSCMDFLEEEGPRAFAEYVELLQKFHKNCKGLQHLRIMDERIRDGKHVWDADLSKILCFTDDSFLSGIELGNLLRQKYHLQMEMSSVNYVLGISSVADTEDGIQRLQKALFEIDQEAEEKSIGIGSCEKLAATDRMVKKLPVLKNSMTIGMAMDYEKELVLLEESLGRTAGCFVYCYPPGIPLIAPGEIITSKILENLWELKKNGLQVQGLEPENKISVLLV